MNLMQRFDTVTSQRKELVRWWSMRDQLAAYDGTNHTLRIDFGKPSMVSFCGQQYAGAQNYHDAPEFFKDAIVSALNAIPYNIAKAAFDAEMVRMDKEIADMKTAILEQLGECGKNNTDKKHEITH